MMAIAGAFALLVGGGAAFVATQNNKLDPNSLLAQNIEALGREEGGSSSNWSCWSQEKRGSGYWRCGNPCRWVDGAGGKGTEGKCYN